MTKIDYEKIYIQYACDIVSGKIIAGKYIKLACERYLNWFNRDDIYFNYEAVDKKIRLIQKLRLREGGNFILLPYQAWIISGIFGFYYKDEPDLRVINNVLLLTARKSGKSTFASAIAIVAAICDGERSPEIAFIANSAKQAGLLFKYCSELCKSVDPDKKIFRRMRNDILIKQVDGQINVLSSDTSKLDGRSDSVFIQDEGHEAKSFEIWNVLKTGQGARRNPLAISISTAGFNIGSIYPLYNQWEYNCKILKGDYEDDTWFAAIYQLDEGDDWKDETVWVKANPSIGITVSYKYMRDQIRQAIQTPSNEVSIKTKNLNMWCQSSNVWISNDYIEKVSDEVNLDDFENEICFSGVDLSAVSDLTSFTVLFPPNEYRTKWPDKFVFKTFVYIPQEALEESLNSDMYKLFRRHNYATITSGNVVDYEYILNDQVKVTSKLQLIAMEYDSWNATQWAINATNIGLPLQPYSQAFGNFNKPTKFLEMIILSDKVVIDNNPCIKWCFSNVELKVDHNDNCKPIKSNNDKNKKIDPVISMIQALGGYLNSPQFNPEIFSI
jgi:phage terminase large subunit-like protein